MTAFAADWLALREPADTQARAPRLVDALRERTAAATQRRLIDLGAGTGAALRYLAPRLGGEQRWLLADADPELLGAARREIAAWARGRGAGVDDTHTALTLRDADLTCRVRLTQADLADGFALIDWDDSAIVSASALLDLVSADWLAGLVEACAAGRNPAWLTLSYDGRIELDPPDALDARVRAAFNRDQQRDKGFGPALGPSAAACAARAFAAAGFSVAREPSDWVLGAGAARLGRALIEGYAEVARTLEPASAGAFAAWQRRRAEQIDAGALTIRVGHADLLALPGA